jgi:hypothetical protein
LLLGYDIGILGDEMTTPVAAAGTSVTTNTVGKNLTVTGNSGEVTDKPNTVGGKSKLQ